MEEDHERAKRLLRRELRTARRHLAPGEVLRLSEAACARVLSLRAFRAARHVVLYAPIDNEVDPSAIATAALGSGKAVYYPPAARCGPGEPFVTRPGSRSRDGGEAAEATAIRALPPEATDAVFVVPGLGFDARGARLGRGDGWYDRALPRHPHGIRIGLAYEFQVVASLPEAAWDVRMHTVVTEARVLNGVAPRTGQ
jgi:5-formyltetrahydrofolate cyclo-ligase